MSTSTPVPSTTTKTPLVITSFPTVPLTTTFTRPAGCGGIYTPTDPAVFIIDNEPSCLPPNHRSRDSSFFYSPGIACPSGYWTACHDTTGAPSITTAICCPTYNEAISLSCMPNMLSQSEVWEMMYCTWMAPPEPGTDITITKSEDNGRTSTVTTRVTALGGINAYGVRMVYEASDLETASSASSSASMLPSTAATGGTGGTNAASNPTDSSSTSSSSSDPSSTSSSSGLSTGAVAAIAVVVPIVVLGALAAGLFLWWRRRKQDQLQHQYQQQPPSTAGGSPSEPPADAHSHMVLPKPHEASSYYGSSPLSQQSHEVSAGAVPPWTPQEMQGAWSPPEMSSTRFVSELPGESAPPPGMGMGPGAGVGRQPGW